MNNNPICFFDSGIGGATILKEVLKKLPNENYIYYADSKNNPYGNKTKKELFEIVDNIVEQLTKYNPKLIVCACNTATAMVLNDIRKTYKDITFIGTEPAVKTIYDKYKTKKTLILTTKGTGESKRFKKLYNTYKTKDTTLIEAPELARIIEKNENPYPYLNKILKDCKNIEIVVLGCTHFPLVKNEISKILPNVEFIDGSMGIANRIENLLQNNKNTSKGSVKIIEAPKKTEERILKIIKK